MEAQRTYLGGMGVLAGTFAVIGIGVGVSTLVDHREQKVRRNAWISLGVCVVVFLAAVAVGWWLVSTQVVPS